MKILNISIWVIVTLLTLDLFYNFDVWFMYAMHYMDENIKDAGTRIFFSMPAFFIAFLFAFLVCILPAFGVASINKLYSHIKGE